MPDASPRRAHETVTSTGSAPNDGADPFAAIVSPVIRSAAAATAENWNNDSGEALDDAELRRELALIARAVDRIARGDDVERGLEPETAASALLRCRIVDRLRAAVVDAWTNATLQPLPAEMLSILRAFERVRESVEPRWDQRFAASLSQPTGLELVVEVAHDLRSPLTSILFLSETLRKGHSGEVNDIQRRQLGIIYSAALGLISVASDVIELARGGDQLVDPAPSPFSVTQIFESIKDIVQPLAEEKGLTIRLSPPATDQRLGYPVALSRVLLNLTTNALKFTDEGMVEIVSQSKGMTQLEFSVRDTGCGIDPEVVDRLYEPFRRSNARRSYYFSGTGLGLSISRKLVEAMGSTLEFETKPGWGTRFYFTLDLPPATSI